MAGNYLVKIKDVAEVYDGPHATPKKIESGPYFLSISSLIDGKLDLSKSAHLSEEQFEKWTKRVTPEHGDVLFSYETRLGEAALMPSGIKGCLGRRMGLLRPDRSKVLPEYLLYAYLSPDFQSEIRKRTIHGATVERIALKELPDFNIRIPSIEEQLNTVKVLSKIDQKLQLNTQTSQTLEQMAQALFKSWFVDFDPVFDNALANGVAVSDFPEALQKKAQQRFEQRQQFESSESDVKPLPADILKLFPSEFEQTDEPSIGINGWIPERWVKSSFESLIKLIGGGTPKTSIEEYWNGDIPWFSVVDAPNDSDVFVLDTEKHVTQLGVDKSSTKILRVGTTIISARGTVGKCALVAEPMAMNQSCYGINAIEGVSDEFIYFMTRHQVSDLQKRGHGSVFNTVTRETFKSILLPFSGSEVTQKFSEVVSPFLNKILLNNKQNVELIKTRDVLLPKLISGEISINSIQ